MKKAWKTIGLIALVLLLFYMFCSIISKHGWRLWGFEKCERPDSLGIETVYVTDETVNVAGETYSSALRYNGYIYKVIDDTLYIGVKYDLNGGGWAGFSLEIKGDFSNLKNVVLKNETEEKCIWNLEKDKKYMEKINKVRLYETVFVDYYNDYYKEQMKSSAFVYADEELLNRIQHPTFSDELYLSKGRHLGIAELDNGEEMYLEFEIHQKWYDVIGAFGHYNY